jgi:hypothetical protein
LTDTAPVLEPYQSHNFPINSCRLLR